MDGTLTDCSGNSRLGEGWAEVRVMVHCDNMGTVAVVNSGYSKVVAVIHLLRCLFFIRACFQFALQAIHTPGLRNPGQAQYPEMISVHSCPRSPMQGTSIKPSYQKT